MNKSQLKNHLPKRKRPKKTNKSQWLEERKKGIGGSDVADVLSLPPYGCAARLWDEKRSLTPDFPQQISPDMERGIMLEPIVIQKYVEHTGNKVKKVETLKSKDNPFMLGNLDGIIIKQAGNSKGVLEIKCPNRENYTRIKRLGLPESYILQMQHYLYLADKEWGEWAIFCADMWELLTLAVKRDEELINMIIEQEDLFWKKVENGPRPDRLEWGDKRCKKCIRRLSCWGDLWDDEKEESGEDIEYEEIDDDELINAIREHKEAVELYKNAEQILEESKGTLIDMIGDREKVKCDYGKIVYARQITRRIDLKRLTNDNPELVEKYKYDMLSRPFRFFPSKDL